MSGVQQGQTRAHAGIKLPARGSLDAEGSFVARTSGPGGGAPRGSGHRLSWEPPGPGRPPAALALRPSAPFPDGGERRSVCRSGGRRGVCGRWVLRRAKRSCARGGPARAPRGTCSCAPGPQAPRRPRQTGVFLRDREMFTLGGTAVHLLASYSVRDKNFFNIKAKKKKEKKEKDDSLFGIRGRGRREGREPAAWLSVFLLWHESSQLSTPGVKSIISYVSNHYSLFCHQF